ncbi:hypothetical protein I4F81_000372 [Pyropia yezoensis]|uniref:Uncharacterized protein n=1 Tax=Pyropia yezoensis TaxID=2788 RepID=A0ACC3BJU7_PYRYE|nr:hypothetical protein I4F81_000372 [Neopyropia yezoensis]
MYAVLICEHNTSAACAGCNNRVFNVYPTPRFPADRRQVANGAALEEATAQPYGAAVGAKVVEPRRRASKCRRSTESRRGGADRDAVKRDKDRALDDAWAAERLEAIVAFVKRAAGRDGAATRMARKCVCVSCLLTYFNRDKSAARKILKAASTQLSGGNKAPFFPGCHVSRPPAGPPPGPDYNWSRETANSWSPRCRGGAARGGASTADAPDAVHDGDDGDESDELDASDEAGDDHLLVPQPLPSTATGAAAVAMDTQEADKMDAVSDALFRVLGSVASSVDRESSRFGFRPWPTSALQSLVADGLSRVLGSVVDGLDRESVRLALWSGRLTLSRLAVKPEALSAPFRLVLDGVTVSAAPLTAPPSAARAARLRTARLTNDDSLRVAAAAAAAAAAAGDPAAPGGIAAAGGGGGGGGGAKASWSSRFLTRAIANVQVDIRDVVIQYSEAATAAAATAGDGGEPYALTLGLGRLQVVSTGADWAPAFVDASEPAIRKAVNLDGLAASCG